MLFSISEYLRLFAFYTLFLIGLGTVYQKSVLLLKRKGISLLEWTQSHYPRFYFWLICKLDCEGVLEERWRSELEKIIPFTETLQKEIDQIQDEHMKEEVSKTLDHVKHVIVYGQNILEKPNDYLYFSDFKMKFHQLTTELFELFEKYYYR